MTNFNFHWVKEMAKDYMMKIGELSMKKEFFSSEYAAALDVLNELCCIRYALYAPKNDPGNEELKNQCKELFNSAIETLDDLGVLRIYIK